MLLNIQSDPRHDLDAAKKEVLNQAGELCLKYKAQGFHCSESIIRSCSEVLGIALPDGVIRAAAGFRGGGGGYGDRCGVVEAGCMIISYLYGRMSPLQAVWPYCYLIRVLHERFQAEMGSLYCRDIQDLEAGHGVATEHTCDRTFELGARIVAGVLLDADELLRNIPEEEMQKDVFGK